MIGNEMVVQGCDQAEENIDTAIRRQLGKLAASA
jgi:hypothetical protein